MAGLNRGLMILITLLAISAAVLSFLLFQKRAEFTDRSSLLAETTANMVKALDAESNTNVSRKVSFTPADSKLGVLESGTLSAVDFHNDKVSGGTDFEANLKAATDLAETISKQRNVLAQTLDEVAYTLKINEGEVSVADLKNAGDPELYETACKKIKSLTEATQKRTEDMINAFSISSTVLGHSLDKTMFTTRESQPDQNGNMIFTSFKHEQELADFNKAVSDMNQRCQDYMNAIVQGIESIHSFNWQTEPSRIQDSLGYAGALTTLSNDFTEINKKLVQAKEDHTALLAKTKELAEMGDKMASTIKNYNDLQRELDTLKAENTKLKNRLGDASVTKTGTGMVPDADKVNKNLRGHVVQVNDKWNYVILDLGENDVRENLPLIVSRGDEYIGKVTVSKVAKNICVADMDSKMMKRPVQEGDVVFLPKGY